MDDTPPPLARRLFAELLGSAFLSAIVIGSGIAAVQLSPHQVGLELAENAAATAAGLYALILIFGPVSGAHFNPVVSAAAAHLRLIGWRDALAYTPAQVMGCIAGAVAANAMFGRAAISLAGHHRASPQHLWAEVVATAGLVLVIFALVQSRRIGPIAAAVGAYIGAAYFFTSSTSFANPAITIGRVFSNSFAGIAAASVPAYVAAQIIGGALGLIAVRVLYPTPAEVTSHEHSPLRLPPERRALADEPSVV
jgi:arsenate reductase